MEMTKREYAEVIVSIIGGEIQEVEKANGVKMLGIIRREEGSNISPTAYVDEFYRDGVDPVFAAQRIDSLLIANSRNNFDVTMFTDFEKVKPNLRARLYNSKTNAEVFMSAEKYGFDDLIIIPYILVKSDFDGQAASKVNKSMLNS